MSTQFLFDGPEDARITLLLAHGAGAPMDSAIDDGDQQCAGGSGFRVARFEFGYMASRRTAEGIRSRRPAEKVMPEFIAAVDEASMTSGPLIIGGKSMGGRVASLLADEAFRQGKAGGLLCLGYPFHPPAKPTQLRTKYLETLKTPALIVQGTRDEFGTREDVSAYPLSDSIEILWLEDGDHDLTPRKKLSGFSAADHLATMAAQVSDWVQRIAP
jgi:predicted alpha/beta-hydrolase family hydrolase